MRVHVLQLVPILALTCYAGEPAVTREGGYWVQTVSGSLAVDRPVLRVQTRGAVRVHGENRGDIYYTLKKRVRARSQDDALEKLRRIEVRYVRGHQWPTLTVIFPDGDSTADLSAVVSRSLQSLVIESQGGSVDARDLGGTVKADVGGGSIEMDSIGGAVTVRTGGGNVRLGRIGGALDCTSGGGTVTAESIGGNAAVHTGGGDITLREVKGVARVSTGGGNLRIERAINSVTATTGSGIIDVVNAGGPVRVQAGTGAIRVQAAKSVSCETGSGAIKVLQVSGGIRVATGSGAIFADLMPGIQDSSLSTGSGDITVTIPSNLAVTVHAIADSPGLRKIVSDFPEIQPRPEARGARAEAQGSLNGGGPLLRVAATGGTVYLRRQKND